jgi:hypothetical protein
MGPRALVVLGAVTVAGCAPAPPIAAPAVREVGLVPSPPGTSGRDGGYSARFAGHSVWIFGDTFFADAAADGYHWRASTWSHTDDGDASDGLGGWTHALGADGKPLALLPHTAAEQSFDDAHNGDPCPAGSDCGARHTAWPGAFVVDPRSGSALVFYTKEETEPSGPFAFHGAGASIATWASPAQPAQRPSVRPDLPDLTVLFPVDEPPWGAAALVDGDQVYAYACPGGGLQSPCRLARAPLGSALDRTAWRFFAGAAWLADWHAAVAIFDGAPIMSVHFSPYLGRFVAFYMVPLGSRMALRTAPRPEGPWSTELQLADGQPALDGSWDYGLLAHPELARDGGRVEYLSYFQPGKFLDGVIHLVELTYR